MSNEYRDDTTQLQSEGMGARSTSPSISPRLFTEQQAAEHIARSDAAIKELRYDGLIPFLQLDTRIMYDVQDLNAWIEEMKRLKGFPLKDRKTQMREWVRASERQAQTMTEVPL